jgi:acetoin utilization deacetylase AcuC-like enzyme
VEEKGWNTAMKIIYNDNLAARYPANPVESPERVALPAQMLRECGYELVDFGPASIEYISRVHGREHIELVRKMGLYEPAALAAGGAIAAAELALAGHPAFALLRPPGHHAAANRAWGMCSFNSMAIAIKKIRPAAMRALIIDIDLHYGDGTASIFRGDPDVRVVNPWAVDESFEYLNMDESRYLKQVEDAFLGFEPDIVAVSAGFDTYLEDWGGLLKLEDYRRIGKAIREGSESCGGCRFALLEGGYLPDLKWCIKSFIEGFQ